MNFREKKNKFVFQRYFYGVHGKKTVLYNYTITYIQINQMYVLHPLLTADPNSNK